MRYVGRYRCEAIQCREENIRMLRSRHWIAARLDVLRIASAAALAMTGQGQAPPLRPIHVPRPRPHPLCGGVPPAGGGVVSPAGRNPRPTLVSDI
ncbi:MAG: hypothetical protein LBM98_08455 [Oscillospiraceae bacterium]|nr:hypothetical protein [Oscillospiraceae bacterium]